MCLSHVCMYVPHTFLCWPVGRSNIQSFREELKPPTNNEYISFQFYFAGAFFELCKKLQHFALKKIEENKQISKKVLFCRFYLNIFCCFILALACLCYSTILHPSISYRNKRETSRSLKCKSLYMRVFMSMLLGCTTVIYI